MVCHDVDHGVVCDGDQSDVVEAYDLLDHDPYSVDHHDYGLNCSYLQKLKSCHCNKKSLLLH